MDQLVATYHTAGCEELQAIHKLVHQLQQVRTIVVFFGYNGGLACGLGEGRCMLVLEGAALTSCTLLLA